MKSRHKIKLLDRVRQIIRLKNYSYSTENSYIYWIKRFIIFHNKRHPKVMGESEIEEFLSHLAIERNVAASTQNQALCSLVFLYKTVLGVDLDSPIVPIRAKRSKRLPVVLTKSEVQRLLRGMSSKYKLMAQILYGSGLRLMECMRLRVKDIDFGQSQIVVRDGKGPKDRITLLPDAIRHDLHRHLLYIRLLYEEDCKNGFVGVSLPYALAVKYPKAQFEWKWQYVFPSKNISRDPHSGKLNRLTPSGCQSTPAILLHGPIEA